MWLCSAHLVFYFVHLDDWTIIVGSASVTYPKAKSAQSIPIQSPLIDSETPQPNLSNFMKVSAAAQIKCQSEGKFEKIFPFLGILRQASQFIL